MKIVSIMSNLRGMDSTGAFFVKRVKEAKKKHHLSYKYRKDLGDTIAYFNNTATKKVIDSEGTNLVIAGHNRQATIGKVTQENAHPFHVNHIIGMHNGTIEAFKPLKGDDENNSDTRVLFNKIATIGLEATLKEAKYGAYALVWADIREGTMNFVRNEKRPLWFITNNNKSTVWWASEPEFLNIMSNRSSHVFTSPFQLEPGKLATFKIGTTEPVMRTLELEEPKIHTFPFWKSGIRTEEKKSTTPPFTLTSTIDKQANNIPMLVKPSLKGVGSRLYRGWKHEVWTISDTLNKMRKGCACCGATRSIFQDITWINESSFICKNHKATDWYTVIVGNKRTTYDGKYLEVNDKYIEVPVNKAVN